MDEKTTKVNGFFITATDTDVGKTYVAAGLASAIQKQFQNQHPSRQVKLWKPVQSGTMIGDQLADSYRLVYGSGLPQSEEDTATYSFQEPLAPYIAARRAGQAIEFERLIHFHERIQAGNSFVIVEGAGGFMVPLTKQHLIADLAQSCGYPVIIVARPGLGTVNHTILTIKQVQAYGLTVQGVIINGCLSENEKFIRENAEMIESFGQVPVIGLLPRWHPQPIHAQSNEFEALAAWQVWRQSWTAIVQEHIQWSKLWDIQSDDIEMND